MRRNTHFNPRSPWGERPSSDFPDSITSDNFNPRSPWGERPLSIARVPMTLKNFNPRSPWGERPDLFFYCRCIFYISIHAPRGGSDYSRLCAMSIVYHFNPRSPWGERLGVLGLLVWSLRFQSTLPVGGATPDQMAQRRHDAISIHAPRGGSDFVHCTCSYDFKEFQSTLPVGGATRS